ncbi:uncharacterized protein N7459_009164 [Penicillium hispanicum]|uniref:uncharacterized protein n=1 Tax=Penicillium hispanicum TaxID=1080232 RepID=UPI0025405432|nr:uncharacterized protein N7459_009164 [Penicillium hispanicum]KAJ5569734.1 hypothetical protein N7459_009164 [Penicillium hispanicum]
MFPNNNRQLGNRHEQLRNNPDEQSETYIPQTLVVGAFLVIFLAQVGVNFLQVMRTGRRQRRQAMELQFPQPLPPQRRAPNWEMGDNSGDDAAQDEGEGPPALGLAHGA